MTLQKKRKKSRFLDFEKKRIKRILELCATFKNSCAISCEKVKVALRKCKRWHNGYSRSSKVIDFRPNRMRLIMTEVLSRTVSELWVTACWSKFLLSTGGYLILMPLFGVNPSTHDHEFWPEKSRMITVPEAPRLWFKPHVRVLNHAVWTISTSSTSATNRQTDRWTDWLTEMR